MTRRLLPYLALALLCAPLSALAEATWYGSLRTYLGYTDATDEEGTTQRYWDLKDYYSRFGVRGANDLGNGLQGVYRLEFAVLTDKAQLRKQARLSQVGLGSGFGTVWLGHQWSPLYEAAFADIDIWNSMDPTFYRGDYRVSSMIRYDAPIAAGNVVLLSTTINGDREGPGGAVLEKDVNAVTVGLKGRWNALTAAFGYDDKSSDDYYTTELTAGWDFGGSSSLWLNAEKSSLPGEEGWVYRVLGAVGLGNHILRVLYAEVEEFADHSIQLGWQYNFSDTTRIAVEWQSSSPLEGPDTRLLNFALRTDF